MNAISAPDIFKLFDLAGMRIPTHSYMYNKNLASIKLSFYLCVRPNFKSLHTPFKSNLLTQMSDVSSLKNV